MKANSARVRLQLEELEQRCLPSSTSYVSSLYTNLLNRPGSVQEVVGWAVQLDLGVPATEVTNAFVTSREYRSDLIRNDYQAFLQRTPQPTEVQGWLNQLENGVGEQQLEAAFLASAEFFALHGNNNGGWVNAVYPTVLGRNPSAEDLAYWTGQLQNGVALQTVALGIIMSPEAEARQVDGAYVQLLGRAPDTAGLAFWSGQLEHGLSPAQLRAQLAAAPEYINLQGGLGFPPPPPSNPTPITNDPNPPTGEVFPSTGFVDPGAFPIPDPGNTGVTPDNTGYTPDITIPDSGNTGSDLGSVGDTGDTSYDPGCDY
ncbi:MAG TPA: DUF4214 domain-containing protein [Gemmataceae bacterium]|jgi:hypothetical protein